MSSDLATKRWARKRLCPVVELVLARSVTWMAILGPIMQSLIGYKPACHWIQTGGWKNCAPPSSANLAAKICSISNGATVSSPLLVKASGNSPAGVNQLQVWIDANDKYIGHAIAAVSVTAP
jgi:hypothetical protein